MTSINNQIPTLIEKIGWSDVLIQENNESLISLKNISDSIIINPKYHEWNFPGAINDCFCRKSTAAKLIKASKLLPKGISFLVWDGWRPASVQQSLFDNYKQELQKEHSNISEKELLTLTQQYVSMPSRNALKPSPHFTGGALDLTLIDENNNLLNMGTDFDFFGKESATNFYENKENLSNFEKEARNNRRILFNVLTSVGFTNYNEEWWHFDYGNQFWGLVCDKEAFYGPIDHFQSTP